MLDSAEPMSLVLWAISAFAAGLYPLGLMLGGTCSPCCGGECGDPPVEFNRCIRFVNTNTSPPQTSYAVGASVDMPLHGYSRAVTRPEQIGAVRVATKLEASGGVLLSKYAASMSSGETRTAKYRFYFNSLAASVGVDLGTVQEWNVTLQGVTRPLDMPATIQPVRCEVYQYGASNSPSVNDYKVGDSRVSVSAPVSVSVHSVRIVSGGEWLDGSTATDATLKALVSAWIEDRSSSLVSTLSFSPGTAFQYVPLWGEVVLTYVIKHSRGSTDRFKTFNVTVVKADPAAVVAIPSGGLTPVTTSQPTYQDTPYGVTPPVFSESNATIYSDNAEWEGAFETVLIPFPSFEITPVGEQMRAYGVFVQPTNGQYLTQAFSSGGYGQVPTTVLERGWIMRPFDPGVGATFDGYGHPVENQWNYDTEAVLSFLSGDSTMPYNSGNQLDPTRLQYGPPPSTTWTMQVSDPTQFCGVSLCTSLGWYSGVMYGEAVASTVTVRTAAWPQTIPSSSSDRTTDYINLCYGQDTPPVISMRLSPYSCEYSGSHTSCINYSSAIGYDKPGGYYVNRDGQGSGQPLSRLRGAPARYFYCGDLLWAIENGPCRTTLTIPYQTWGNETYTLGGDDTSSSQNDWLCPASSVDQAGKCHPTEATLTLDEDIRLGRGASGDSSEVFAGKIIAGDYVMNLIGGGWIYDTNCNQQVYGFDFPVQPVNVAAYIRHYALLVRRREAWCRDWDSTGFPFVQGGCFYTMSRMTGAFSGLCGVSIGSTVGWANLPAFPGSVSFGQQTIPYATTVTPQASTVSRDGGTVQLTFCCPNRTDTVSIQANAGRYARKFFVESSATAGRGATAYITQAGYEGVERLFDVIWLSGSTGYGSYYLASEFPGRIFWSDSCPIVGQVSPSEQPEYEWSVTASENWIVAGKTDDGLLTISIDNNVTPVFAQPIYYNFTERQARRANITITSSGTTKSWTIIQLKP